MVSDERLKQIEDSPLAKATSIVPELIAAVRKLQGRLQFRDWHNKGKISDLQARVRALKAKHIVNA